MVLIFLGILILVFLLPLYQEYKKNQEILTLKETLIQTKSEVMTKETYDHKIAAIEEKSQKIKQEIPEIMEIAKIYEALIDLAEMAEMELTFIEFQNPKALIFEKEKSEEFQEDQELRDFEGDRLMGVKGRLKGIGGSQALFLEAIENYQPMIKIHRIEIKENEEGKQLLVLDIESYAFLNDLENEFL